MTSSLAYRNLSKAQSGLQTTLERLSSGLRINKATDDSASLAISIRMNNQIMGMKQANRNAQDANHMVQIAEGGLRGISSTLAQMRELAVQASTDTLNNSDRISINLEFQALRDEIDRLANVTEYNGMNILNATHQTVEEKGTWKLQIGADNDGNNQVELKIMDATAEGLGLLKLMPYDNIVLSSIGNDVTTIENSISVVINGYEITSGVDLSGADLTGLAFMRLT